MQLALLLNLQRLLISGAQSSGLRKGSPPFTLAGRTRRKDPERSPELQDK